MITNKGETPTKPSATQAVTLNVARALKVEVVLKAEADPDPVEVASLRHLVQDYSEAAESSKQALAAEAKADNVAASAAAAAELVNELQDAAKHAALSGGADTAKQLLEAQNHQKRLQIYANLAAAEVAKLQKAFAQALQAPQPKKKKGQGLAGMKAAMLENLKAQQAYDATVQRAIAEAIKTITGYADKAAGESEPIEKLHLAWQALVAKHDREAEAERQRAEAIKQAKQLVQLGETAYAEADKNKLLDKAKALGIKLPDLVGLNDTMKAAALKEAWPAADIAAQTLIRTINQLDKTITVVTDLKDDFVEAKKRTSGRLTKLTQRFDGAHVSDAAVLNILSDLLVLANQHAGAKEWEQAGEAITEFEKKFKEAEDLAEEFEYYSDGTTPRLLTGTIIAVLKALPKGSDNKAALARLKAVFGDQCMVDRGEWLTLLGIAGDNVKVGPAADHYTTFNNSLPMGTDVSVLNRASNAAGALAVCGDLFEKVVPVLRIHSTIVVGINRYHRYWSRGPAIYSVNVANPNPHAPLDARYQTMVNDMRSKVLDVIKVYGRVGTKRLGPKV